MLEKYNDENDMDGAGMGDSDDEDYGTDYLEVRIFAVFCFIHAKLVFSSININNFLTSGGEDEFFSCIFIHFLRQSVVN